MALAVLSLIGTIAGLRFNAQLAALKKENESLHKDIDHLKEENGFLRDSMKALQAKYDDLFARYEAALKRAAKDGF